MVSALELELAVPVEKFVIKEFLIKNVCGEECRKTVFPFLMAYFSIKVTSNFVEKKLVTIEYSLALI